MSEYVHVKDQKTGHEYPWPAHLVEGIEGIEVTGKDTTDATGDLVPPKYKTTVAKSAAAKKATTGRQADTDKEND